MFIADKIAMNSIKSSQNETKRFSLNEYNFKTQKKELNQYLPVCSQTSEHLPPQFDIQFRKFSQQCLDINHVNPENKRVRKLPPMLRYQSQKYLKQLENKRLKEKDEYFQNPKKFTIHTISLKHLNQLQPLVSNKTPSLPKIKKKAGEISDKDKNLQWITPEQMVSMKIILDRKNVVKMSSESTHIISERKGNKGAKANILKKKKNDISGWNINDHQEAYLYQ